METTLLTFDEMVLRIKRAFPDYDISGVQRIAIRDSRNRVEQRDGWQIVLAENLVEIDRD